MTPKSNDLFSNYDFASQLDVTKNQALEEVNKINGDELLNTSPSALVEYFVEKYKVEVPILDETGINVDQEEGRSEATGLVGTWFNYYIPFSGEAPIFQSRPSSYMIPPPQGVVSGTELKLSYWIAQSQTTDVVAQQYKRDLAHVKQTLETMRQAATQHNSQLGGHVQQAIDRRREKLLKDRNQVAALGYPLRARQGQQTYVAPSVRRKPAIQRPSGGTAPFKPEPVLDMAEYERIIELMASVGRTMELSPSAFRDLDEEDLRTHFLVQLNGHYEGKASAETFNLAGKTDIIIRDGDRNIFIAECKFWSGPKGLSDALDQLLAYTSWRDTKTALLLFNRERELSKVLAKIPDTALEHRYCRKRLDYGSETGFRFVFRHPDDSGRELTLTILVFEVPS